MKKEPFITIDTSALKNNFNVVKSIVGDTKIMTAIKANAYGHGILEAAHTFSDADALAIARIEEVIRLRKYGVEKELVVLGDTHSSDNLNACEKYNLTPTIHTLEGVKLLRSEFPSLKFWLKVDTGMHRLGFSIDETKDIAPLVKGLSCQGLMSHCSDAEILEHPSNALHLQLLKSTAETLNIDTLSLANSAGIMYHDDFHLDWVRPGIMLYGQNPSSTLSTQFSEQLKPVMTFNAFIIDIKTLKAGESIGYNGKWTANRDSQIAIIGCGYGDGYPRHAKNGTPVYIRDKIAPLAGRVSMDLITVDVTGLHDVTIGDEVELWGKNISASEVASCADTISYELFTSITDRVSRYYSD